MSLARCLQALERLPFVAAPDVHRRAEHVHLRGRHQARVIVLVSGERQAETLDRVADEADGTVVIDGFESLDERGHVMAAEIAHQTRQLVVRARFDQRRHRPVIADVGHQARAPRRSALEHQRGVELVRARVDPFSQRLAARLAERSALERSVLQDHDVPAKVPEQLLVTLPEPLAYDGIEALPVVVDHPPAIAQPLFPALQQRFENVALVELGIAGERDHAALAPARAPAMRADIVLHERGEERLSDAKADRSGGKVDIVGVLGPRRIGLGAAIAAEVFESFLRLLSEQVLDRVVGRRRMRLDRNTVFGPEHAEIERRKDRDERSR